jgi:hypothetical protein
MGRGGIDWIGLDRDRNQLSALVKFIMKLWIP